MAGVCSTPGCPEYSTVRGRCPAHAREQDRHQARTVPTKASRDWRERQRRAAAVRAHIAKHGHRCLGDEHHPAHDCHDLTAHHTNPIAGGGKPTGRLVVICRSANSSIGAGPLGG